MVRRTAAEAAETREALLDAAERVFLERGVASATLEQIAQRAGVTRGAIYWHFRDKNDLFGAMLERVRLPLEEIAGNYRQRHPGDDPLGVLQHLCRLALARLDESETYRNVYDILMNRCEFASDINPAFARQVEIYNENIRTVRNEFSRAQALGQLRSGVDPRIAALALGALMHGLYVSWLRQPSRFAILEDGEVALELFFAGLRAP
jgi:TetR/AcrR family transcriptional regulator, repressor of the mexAB-oprM multidrug resistance operon